MIIIMIIIVIVAILLLLITICRHSSVATGTPHGNPVVKIIKINDEILMQKVILI